MSRLNKFRISGIPLVGEFDTDMSGQFSSAPSTIISGRGSFVDSAILRLMYASALPLRHDAPSEKATNEFVARKIAGVMRLDTVGQLADRTSGSRAEVCLSGDPMEYEYSFSSRSSARVDGSRSIRGQARGNFLFLPKDNMLVNDWSLVSALRSRRTNMDETWADITNNLWTPPLREYGAKFQVGDVFQDLGGTTSEWTIQRGESTFIVRDENGRSIPSALISTGVSQVLEVAILVANGRLGEGDVLFWEEYDNVDLEMVSPSTLTDPAVYLSEMGVQVICSSPRAMD